ncbi:hypothetical protein WS105_0627 [Weissella ceti]|uniref:hypothetical protein n=1 Tax=Weissella ceti TaxID=759620 RepID=UPI0004F82317|nr:hypothetical protein [Weissella ceti]AIM64217.1 hypothetical protein WS105_0627 [Weissella ceti]
MKIKIVDIHSQYTEEYLGTCETCYSFPETTDVTTVDIQWVGTDEIETVEFNNQHENAIEDWKFDDWIKFSDYLAGWQTNGKLGLETSFKLLVNIFNEEVRSNAK